MNTRQRDRRRFLKGGAVLGGLAVGAMRPASAQTPGSETPGARPRNDIEMSFRTRAYGERSRFENPSRMVGRYGLMTPVQDLAGIITPSALHYTASHGYDPPEIDPRQHRLLIHGLVDRPLILTVEEVKRLPSVSRIHYLECGANSGIAEGPNRRTVQQTYGYMSCSEWTGVLLSVLLREAGVQKGASWLVAEGAEAGKHAKSIALEKALEDCMVAYGQNGEPVRPEQGYPFRLLVPGWVGLNHVKWLRRIKVVDQPYMTKWETSAYSRQMPDGTARWFQYEMPPKSVLTRPSGGQKLPGPGFYEITGVAWSGRGAIRRVEVSADGGRTWKQAQLQEPVYRKALTRFRLDWTWDGNETVLQSRCTDESGAVQSAEYLLPWKLTREGSVHNALL